MIDSYKLSVDLQISHIILFLALLLSELKIERAFSLPNFLGKAHLWKFVYGFFYPDGNCGGKTDKLNFSVWMISFLRGVVGSFHKLKLAGFLPNILDSAHVAVNIESNDVLVVV